MSVPNVVGLTQAAATTAITGAGLVLGTVTTQYSATVPAGSVISQNPLGGAAWRRARRWTWWCPAVRPGERTERGRPHAGGGDHGDHRCGPGARHGDDAVQCERAGRQRDQSEPAAGTSVAPGSAVDLVVSSGPAPVSVPNVVGLTQAAATTAITGAGLVLGTVTTQYSGSVPAGSVISQNPLGGASVAPGSAVDLVVSAVRPR